MDQVDSARRRSTMTTGTLMCQPGKTYQRVCISLNHDFTKHHEDVVLRLEPCRVVLGPYEHEMILQGRNGLSIVSSGNRVIFAYPKSIYSPNRSTCRNGLVFCSLIICNGNVDGPGFEVRQTFRRVTQIPSYLFSICSSTKATRLPFYAKTTY